VILLVIYDIPDDRVRTRVADACLDYGLARIQYSAFVGTLSRTHQEELLLKLRRHLGRKAGYIQCFPLCQTDWAARQAVGRPLLAGATAVSSAKGAAND
jgi:CRISPR-associated protein Cas2